MFNKYIYICSPEQKTEKNIYFFSSRKQKLNHNTFSEEKLQKKQVIFLVSSLWKMQRHLLHVYLVSLVAWCQNNTA